MSRLAQTAGLTDVQTEILSAVKSFVDKEILPHATELEHKDEFPEAIVEGMKEMGLFGLTIDEQYGGLGLSQSGYCRVMEEFGYVDGTLAVVMGVHQSIGTKPLYLYGTDDQKARWLPDLAAGRKLAAFVLTEPNVGSDAYNLETWAERQSDGSWLLNGEKRWIGNGDKDVLTVFARSDLGHVALIVEKGVEGLRTRDIAAYRRVLGERISALPHVAQTSTFVAMETVKDR